MQVTTEMIEAAEQAMRDLGFSADDAGECAGEIIQRALDTQQEQQL